MRAPKYPPTAPAAIAAIRMLFSVFVITPEVGSARFPQPYNRQAR
jgi:hypothetical protein